MTLQNIPIVEGPVFWVSGLRLARASDTTATVAAGYARDSQNQMTLSTSASVTINMATNGINGLDTGSFAASTSYAVYMVGDVQGRNDTGFVASTSATAPTLPAGYSNYVRIGWLRSDGSTHLLAFQQAGSAGTRIYQWNAAIVALAGGSSATFAAVTLETCMPASLQTPASLILSFTPNAEADIALIRPTGSAEATLTPIKMTGVTAAKAQYISNQVIIPITVSSKPSIDYLVTASGALSIWVSGYTDYIGL